MVYAIYCEEDRITRRIEEERGRRIRNGSFGKATPAWQRRSPETREMELQRRTRTIGSQIRRKSIKPEKILDNRMGSYEEYEIQHQYKRPCRYEHGEHFNVAGASINARGNLCESLFPLSVVSRQLQSETWVYSFPAGPDRLKYQVTIRNFSVFPFFRLAQLLQRQNIQIRGNMVETEFEDEKSDDNWYSRDSRDSSCWDEKEEETEEETETEEDKVNNDDKDCDSSRYATRFQRLTRLMELHWLQGVPLWNCFTNARCDWNQQDHDKMTLGAWLYSIRQIVALHRINASAWRDLSTQLLRRHDIIHNNEFFWPPADASMVEAVIGVFSEALECRLARAGCYAQGRYGDAGAKRGSHEVEESARQYSGSRFASGDQIATECGHAVVHIVNLYRVKVDGALRLELGDVYEEWEQAEDEKKVPEDVVF